MANQTIISLDLSSSTVTSVTLSDYYAPKASPVFTGTVNIGGATSVSLPTNTSIGNVSATELGYLDGVTSNIQSQLSTISLSGSVSGNVILPAYVTNSAGAIVFEGSTADNNQLFLIPTDPASDVYLTLPAITDTLVTKTTTDTFTNKTFDTSAVGNVFRVNGTSLTATTGTGSTVVLSASPTLTGTATVSDLTINGNLTVNGTTTTINSTTLTVDDKLIELGDVASPTDTTANGGGVLLKSAASNKTILWDSTNANWTSSENFNIPTGKTYKINNVTLLDTNAPKSMATLMGYTSTVTSAAPVTLTNSSSYYQQFTGSTAQTIILPVTSTLITGWTFHIVNNSSVNLTVQSSGSNTVITVIPGTTAMVTCIGTTQTSAADWESGITDFSTYTGTGGDVVLSASPTITTPTINTSIITGVNFTLAAAATTLSIGGTPTSAITHNYSANATASGITKAINIGTAGVSGSITNITLGSTVAGAIGTTQITGSIRLVPPSSSAITATTYSVAVTDTFLIFNTSASCTVTLPTASSYPGRIIWMKQIAAFTVISATSNVQPLTSTTAGTAILSGAGKFAQLVSNGTDWVIVNAN